MAGSSRYNIISEHLFSRFSSYFEPLLKDLDIDPNVLNRPDIEIPDQSYADMWEALTDYHGASAPLLIGNQIVPGDLGPMGHAFSNAPTIRSALETLSRFIPVYAQAKRIDFEFTSDNLIVSYAITDASVINRQPVTEFALAAILRLIRLAAIRELTPRRVDMQLTASAAKTNTEAYQQVFGCPVHFGQGSNCLYFDISLADEPLINSDERLFNALMPYLEHQLKLRANEDPLLRETRDSIRESLREGAPSLKCISEKLGASPRTLQRRLQKAGTEFSQLVDDVRHEAAVAYIHLPKYSLTEVAMLLGYSESSAFCRAFRRWTGQTPQQFRVNLT